MEKLLFTSESVTEGHPDKMCDAISDAILDACMEQDPMSRVACETASCTGFVLVTGEIKHHEINAANELGVNIVDAGHFKSEDVVILPLINKLSDNFSDVIFTKSKAYSDNIKFI